MIPVQKQLAEKYEQHSELMQSMANSIGVDMGKAVLRDELRFFPYRDLVFRCTRCTQVEACKGWVAAQDGTATQTPDYCRNKGILDTLRSAV
ncbi:DUF6455 family protein [Aliisedimentitalea scapharcae]|uniref:DUF6455 family protein n=1 Tax=Aliisedimentitalea scapharcae TaxID=1524259 RepID=A0ABZ2XQS1_9RHOB|nr:hypothetical protein K3727_13655 [Rhodobacteraceae bacterium M382]